MLKIKEVAEWFQVTPKTIRKEIKRGNLPAVKIGSTWRINAENLKTYLEQNETSNKSLGCLPGSE